MQADVAQVKALITRDLKHRVDVALAVRGEKFARWLRRELEKLCDAAPGEDYVTRQRIEANSQQ
jgi:hypothetical protein